MRLYSKELLKTLLILATWLNYAACWDLAVLATPLSSHKDFTSAYNAYLSRLREKVLRCWLVPDGKNQVIVQAVVQQDGSVTQLSASSTPTNAAAEQAASEAFNQSQPLEALPANSPPAKITLTFRSSADPHGDSTSSLEAKLEPIILRPSSPAQ